jgi:hypothetical protein
MSFRHRPTPCSSGHQAQQHFSLPSCVSDCHTGRADNNVCDTYAAKALCGDGRACANGKQGLDHLGNCLPATGDAREAYDYLTGSCAAGGCDQDDACRAACATITRKQPGYVGSDTDGYTASCPNGRRPCGSDKSCVDWCNEHGVPGGQPECSMGKATWLKGAHRSMNLTDTVRDPSASRYKAADAEVADHFDKVCRKQENEAQRYEQEWNDRTQARINNGGNYAPRYKQKVSTAATSVPLHIQLEKTRQDSCRGGVDGSGPRNFGCEAQYTAYDDRLLYEQLAVKDMEKKAAWRENRYAAYGGGGQRKAAGAIMPKAKDGRRIKRVVIEYYETDEQTNEEAVKDEAKEAVRDEAKEAVRDEAKEAAKEEAPGATTSAPAPMTYASLQTTGLHYF